MAYLSDWDQKSTSFINRFQFAWKGCAMVLYGNVSLFFFQMRCMMGMVDNWMWYDSRIGFVSRQFGVTFDWHNDSKSKKVFSSTFISDANVNQSEVIYVHIQHILKNTTIQAVSEGEGEIERNRPSDFMRSLALALF